MSFTNLKFQHQKKVSGCLDILGIGNFLFFFSGFKFKRPGNSLSLSKSKPPSALISNDRQATSAKPTGFGVTQSRDEKKQLALSKPASFGVVQKRESDRQAVYSKPTDFNDDWNKDEDVTFVSQTKPLRELTNIVEPQKMVDKVKKVNMVTGKVFSERIHGIHVVL